MSLALRPWPITLVVQLLTFPTVTADHPGGAEYLRFLMDLVTRRPVARAPSMSTHVFHFLALTESIKVPTALKLCISPSASPQGGGGGGLLKITSATLHTSSPKRHFAMAASIDKVRQDNHVCIMGSSPGVPLHKHPSQP